MIEVMEEQQSIPNRLDSVDSGISDEPESASSVSPNWCPTFSPISSSSMEDLDGGPPFFVAGERGGSRISPEQVREIAYELAYDLVSYTTGNTTKLASRYCSTLRRLCEDLSSKHKVTFASLVQKLNLTDDDLDCDFLERVWDRMFSDEQYSWGRIVTFYTFAGWLARHCVDSQMNPQWPDRIAHKTGKLIADKAGNWIIKAGGWDAMDEFFEEPNSLESKIWKGLLYTALGLGALATAVAVVR